MPWGEYPAEYNAKVHGPYDPARYYGKADTKFSQVKLGELVSWVGRRNKDPQSIVSAMSRSWWRYQHKWVHPLKATMAGPLQLVFCFMGFFYFINYGKYARHRTYKHHW